MSKHRGRLHHKRLSDTRFLKTEQAIARALLGALGKNLLPISHITKLCHNAKISPPSFYNHYATLSDALIAIENQIRQEYLTFIATHPHHSTDLLFRKIFLTICRHRQYFSAMLKLDNYRLLLFLVDQAVCDVNIYHNPHVKNVIKYEILAIIILWLNEQHFSTHHLQPYLRAAVLLTTTANRRLGKYL